MRDYRRFILAHLQFLTGLCDLSMQSVNDSVSQFLTSLLITTQLQSPIVFHAQIDSLVTKSKSDAPLVFARFLSLLRATNHGNSLISTYQTNFQYYFTEWSPMNSLRDRKYIYYCSKMRSSKIFVKKRDTDTKILGEKNLFYFMVVSRTVNHDKNYR